MHPAVVIQPTSARQPPGQPQPSPQRRARLLRPVQLQRRMAAAAPPGGTHSAAVHDARSNALYAMSKKIAGHFPHVPVINCTDLKRMLDDPRLAQTVVVVDVRGPEETDVSMIPGSLTADEFEARKGEFAGKTVVAYCTVGYRSSSYASKLRQQGLEAKNLEGSIVRWCQKRYPVVVRSKGSDGSIQETETKRVHTYGKQWALQPDDCEAVMFKRPFLAGVRSLLPSWLGGPRKKQAS